MENSPLAHIWHNFKSMNQMQDYKQNPEGKKSKMKSCSLIPCTFLPYKSYYYMRPSLSADVACAPQCPLMAEFYILLPKCLSPKE